MVNKQGKTVVERLNEDIEFAESIKTVADRKLLAHKALGAIDFAVEFGLITYREWELYINRVFKMI